MITFNPRIAAVMSDSEREVYYHQCGFTQAITDIPLAELQADVVDLECEAEEAANAENKELDDACERADKAEDALREHKMQIRAAVDDLCRLIDGTKRMGNRKEVGVLLDKLVALSQ